MNDEHKEAMLEAQIQELNIKLAKAIEHSTERESLMWRAKTRANHLEKILRAITTTFEAAVRHAETKGSGGQQVSFHGDFGHVPPSAVTRMKWWAREFRNVLKEC